LKTQAKKTNGKHTKFEQKQQCGVLKVKSLTKMNYEIAKLAPHSSQ
jgi:hypothetical protein